MDNDDETTKIAAQEIDHEAPNESPPETENAEATDAGKPSSNMSRSSIEHKDQKLSEKKENVEAARAEDITPPPIKVPRSQRRGLFGRCTLLAEITEPKHYSRAVKWWITFIVALAAIAAPMGSAIILPSLGQIAADLHTSEAITNFSTAFYMLSMAIFPLWWSSFSESLGRRTIYLISFALFLLWNVLAAVSVNISMLVVMRTLGGGAAASVQAVGAGTIADIWEVKERGKAMGTFYLGPLMGPLLAPIIGGALAERFGWRSTLWFLAIYGAVLLIFLFFALPETLKAAPQQSLDENKEDHHKLASTTSRTSAAAQETKKWIKMLKRIFIDPLSITLYLRHPPVLLTVYYASITFGSLYLLNISLEYTFSRPPYNFSTIILGLTYVPNSVGYLLASLLGGRWTDVIMAREARNAGRYDEDGKLMYRPEDRMRENAWIAAILYPGALIWYGWTAQKGLLWPVPLIANFFFGVGSMLIFSMATTMLTEFMPRKASAGVAVNNFVRNICSCVGAVVAQPWIEAIGNGWVFTIIGLIALSSCVVVWAMRRFGPGWRDEMVKELG